MPPRHNYTHEEKPSSPSSIQCSPVSVFDLTLPELTSEEEFPKRTHKKRSFPLPSDPILGILRSFTFQPPINKRYRKRERIHSYVIVNEQEVPFVKKRKVRRANGARRVSSGSDVVVKKEGEPFSKEEKLNVEKIGDLEGVRFNKGDYVKVRRVSKKEDGVSLDYGEWIWGIIHHAGEYTNDRIEQEWGYMVHYLDMNHRDTEKGERVRTSLFFASYGEIQSACHSTVPYYIKQLGLP